MTFLPCTPPNFIGCESFCVGELLFFSSIKKDLQTSNNKLCITLPGAMAVRFFGGLRKIYGRKRPGGKDKKRFDPQKKTSCLPLYWLFDKDPYI